MTTMRLLRILFPAILFIGLIIIPAACAENVNATPDSTPFITIDPIGNHTVGDIFFINGTTNLPVTENLRMAFQNGVDLTSRIKSDSGGFHYIWNNDSVSISSGTFGTNRLSVNVTDIAIKNLSGYPCPCHQYYSPDDFRRCSFCNIWIIYIIDHRDGTDKIIYNINNDNSEFTLIPATNITPSNVPQTTIQSPSSIQPTSSQTIVPITTQSSSLPFVLPIVVLVAIAILRHIYSKKHE